MPSHHKGPRKPSESAHSEPESGAKSRGANEPDSAEPAKDSPNHHSANGAKPENPQGASQQGSAEEPKGKEEGERGGTGEKVDFKLEGYASFDISYTLGMSLYHLYLTHHFLSTVFLCEPAGCLRITTFAHWVWVIHGLFYLFCTLGRWIPALEIFALNWMIHPLNGSLFVAAFYTPGSSTLTALYNHWDGEHYFGSIGSFSGVYFPIVYFWVFLYLKRNQVSLFLYDVQHQETSWELIVRLLFELLSPFLVIISWEVFLRGSPHGHMETDIPQYPGTFWILGLLLLVNGALSILLAAGTAFYKGHVVWLDFPKEACVLYEDPEVKGVLRIAAFQ